VPTCIHVDWWRLVPMHRGQGHCLSPHNAASTSDAFLSPVFNYLAGLTRRNSTCCAEQLSLKLSHRDLTEIKVHEACPFADDVTWHSASPAVHYVNRIVRSIIVSTPPFIHPSVNPADCSLDRSINRRNERMPLTDRPRSLFD